VGVRIDTADSTEEAMRALKKRRFDLVISDWERVPRKDRKTSEGMRLLREMRRAHIFTPLIFYAGALPPRQLVARRAEVAAAGAAGFTAIPTELLRWCFGELVRGVAFDAKAAFVETPLYAGDGNAPPARGSTSSRRPRPRR
jgi:hypothetical protein